MAAIVRRRRLTAALLTVLSAHLGLAAMARADRADEAVRAVFREHCLSCHGAKQSEARYSDGFRGSILDLEQIARDPHLVVPGNPDASRLYNVMLLRQMPPPGGVTGKPPPSAAALAAVRDWIAGVTSEPARCGAAAPTDVARWIATDLEARRDPRRTRYLVIGGVTATCLDDSEATQTTAELRVLLHRLQRGVRSIGMVPIAARSDIYRINLAEIGWTAADWEEAVARSAYRIAPRTLDYERMVQLSGSTLPYLRADEIAHRLLVLHADLPGDFGASVLARQYARDLDLWAAAAELGIPQAEAAVILERAHGRAKVAARRLLAGTLPRAVFAESFLDLVEQLTDARIVAGGPSAAEPAADGLAILADRGVYRVGELMTFSISSSRNCRLQVINVDAEGQATVLYPNDFQQARTLRARWTLELPGATAPYQLRAERPGVEWLVAECLGDVDAGLVRHNFSSQRFTTIGDYDDLLARKLALPAAKAGDDWRVRTAIRIEIR